MRPLLLLSLLLGGCGQDRAVRVTFVLDAPATELCVLAGDGRNPSFVERYDAAALPSPASLTFAAGSAARATAAVGAYTLTGGSVTGLGHLTIDFDGEPELTLRVGRCRDAAGLGLRPSGTFATLLPGTSLRAADLDGDGREELLALASDGSLAVLDAEDPDLGSRRATELVARDGTLAASGDLDGDCRIDLLALASLGVLRVIGADGSSPAPIGEGSPTAAAILVPVPGARALVAVGGAGGVTLLQSSGLEIGPLSGDAAAFVVAADLDGSGGVDVVAGGPGATRVFFADAGGLTEVPGAGSGILAPASGPAVAGDFDGDGHDDVAIVDGAALRVLHHSGGALGALPNSIALGTVRTLAAADLDGDCVAELVILEDGGNVRVLAGGTLAERSGPGVPADQLTTGDVDGDGALEVALLGSGGRVTLWRP